MSKWDYVRAVYYLDAEGGRIYDGNTKEYSGTDFTTESKMLKDMGERGWELVSVISIARDSKTSEALKELDSPKVVFYFKRPILD